MRPVSNWRASSVSIGAHPGQVVMQGFIRKRIPLFLRRSLTMIPALTVLALGRVGSGLTTVTTGQRHLDRPGYPCRCCPQRTARGRRTSHPS